jgi:hypothetical protein
MTCTLTSLNYGGLDLECTMKRPPPPYTLAPLDTWTLATSADAEGRLQRFLLDTVAFVYEVDNIALREAMTSSNIESAASPPYSNPALASIPHNPSEVSTVSSTSILSQADRNDILYLATNVHEVFEKVQKHQQSLITRNELAFVWLHIVLPSEQLRIDAGYSLDLLNSYATHKGIDRQLAAYHYHTRFPFIGRFMWSQERIARRAISDDNLVRRIAPNEQTRLLLGSAIANFQDMYLRDQNMVQLSEVFYTSSTAMVVYDLIVRRVSGVRRYPTLSLMFSP